MPTIGSRTHAREIHEWFMQPSTRRHVPKTGWGLLGSGSFRYAYLHQESDVVYKLETYTDNAQYSNARELRNARLLRSGTENGYITPKCRIPAVSGFRFGDDLVLAMECIRGYMHKAYYTGHTLARKGRMDLLLHGRFEDMHSLNYIIEKGNVVVPIDLASSRVRRVARADLRIIEGLPEYNKYYSEKRQLWNEGY